MVKPFSLPNDRLGTSLTTIEGWGKGYVAQELNRDFVALRDRIAGSVGNSVIKKVLSGNTVHFGDLEKDMRYGQIMVFGKHKTDLQVIATNNVVAGMLEFVELEGDLDLALDIAKVYAAAYTVAAAQKGAPAGFAARSNYDEDFWQSIYGGQHLNHSMVEPFRFAAGTVQLVFEDRLQAEIPEENSVPMYAVSLANPMAEQETRLFAAQIAVI